MDRVDHVGKERKTCTRCNQLKIIDDFYLVRHWSNGRWYRQAQCRICDNARRKTDNNTNKERNRWRTIRKLYGLSREQWEKAFEEQGSACAICKTTNPGTKGWQTEHNHNTGKFRGITCGKCNSLIGYAFDNPDILRAAATYLEERA